jgi:ASCH domain
MSNISKVISIRQPWAWLIVNGYKCVENRTWSTSYRGPIFIHAAKGMTKREYQECKDFALEIAPNIPFPKFEELDRGGIVGSADLHAIATHGTQWFTGPFGLLLRDQKPLPFKPCGGALGVFGVEHLKWPDSQ